MYTAQSIPEDISDALITGMAEEMGVTQADLREVLALGRPHTEWVLPKGVIKTLKVDFEIYGKKDHAEVKEGALLSIP